MVYGASFEDGIYAVTTRRGQSNDSYVAYSQPTSCEPIEQLCAQSL